MDTNQKFRAAWRLLDAAKRMAEKIEGWEARSRVEDIQIHDGYAEPGYSGDVVATGNWNTIDRYDRETRTRIDVSDLPRRLGDALERIGVEIEWSDEWTTCDSCNKLVRTSANSYSWKPSFHADDNGITCEACILDDPGDYLGSLEGDTDKAVTLEIDLTEHGYILLQDGYEHGFHPGQDADPKLIGKALQAQGISRFLFKLDDVGQFDQRFSVYVHADEIAELDVDAFKASPSDGPSVSGALERALRDASTKLAKLEGDGIKVALCRADGTADVKLVSREDFLDGKALK